MINVSTNYKLNLLHGATLAGVDSGFSTFCLSWKSQGLRAWASPPESLHPIPTRSPKSTYIYLSHSPNDCHSPTASEKQEKTLEEGEREWFEDVWSLFLVILVHWSEHLILIHCAEEISGSDITRGALKRCNGSMRHDRVTDLRAASLRPLRRGVGVGRCWLGTCGHDNGDDLTDGTWKPAYISIQSNDLMETKQLKYLSPWRWNLTP